MPNYELERALDTTAVCVRCGDEDRVEVMHKHLVNDEIAYLCDDCEDKENN